MKIVSFALATAAIISVGSVANAQTAKSVKKFEKVHSVKRLQHDPLSGAVSVQKAAPMAIYANTVSTGYFTRLSGPPADEFLDWGVVTSNAVGGPGPFIDSNGHHCVTGVGFGYATNGISAAIRFTCYDNNLGWCGGAGTVVLDVSVIGLPGSTSATANAGWLIGLDLNLAGLCFDQQDNPIAYGYRNSVDTFAGPLINSGGHGNQNVFNLIDSLGSCGNYWFGGVPWAGFNASYTAIDAVVSMFSGCVGGVAGGSTLSITGCTCAGSGVVNLSITPTATAVGGPFGFVIGDTVGAGIGGTFGSGCALDTTFLGQRNLTMQVISNWQTA